MSIVMGRKAKAELESACCGQDIGMNAGGCRVEAMVCVDERGQMVLPKEIRDKIGIKAGDKLVLVSWQSGDEVCCISLIKTDYFMGMLNDKLGPMMGELTNKK
jgi:antitoxin PrlF